MHQVSILNQRLKPKKLQFRKYPKYDLKVHLKNRGVDDKSDFIDFTLSNARRFYSSNARPPGSEREKNYLAQPFFQNCALHFRVSLCPCRCYSAFKPISSKVVGWESGEGFGCSYWSQNNQQR